MNIDFIKVIYYQIIIALDIGNIFKRLFNSVLKIQLHLQKLEEVSSFFKIASILSRQLDAIYLDNE